MGLNATIDRASKPTTRTIREFTPTLVVTSQALTGGERTQAGSSLKMRRCGKPSRSPWPQRLYDSRSAMPLAVLTSPLPPPPLPNRPTRHPESVESVVTLRSLSHFRGGSQSLCRMELSSCPIPSTSASLRKPSCQWTCIWRTARRRISSPLILEVELPRTLRLETRPPRVNSKIRLRRSIGTSSAP